MAFSNLLLLSPLCNSTLFVALVFFHKRQLLMVIFKHLCKSNLHRFPAHATLIGLLFLNQSITFQTPRLAFNTLVIFRLVSRTYHSLVNLT